MPIPAFQRLDGPFWIWLDVLCGSMSAISTTFTYHSKSFPLHHVREFHGIESGPKLGITRGLGVSLSRIRCHDFLGASGTPTACIFCAAERVLKGNASRSRSCCASWQSGILLRSSQVGFHTYPGSTTSKRHEHTHTHIYIYSNLYMLTRSRGLPKSTIHPKLMRRIVKPRPRIVSPIVAGYSSMLMTTTTALIHLLNFEYFQPNQVRRPRCVIAIRRKNNLIRVASTKTVHIHI